MSPTLKPSNPKDALAGFKIPLALNPTTAAAHQALAHLDGAKKYGPFNWRESGVRASVYMSALLRHVHRYMEGETVDPESGVHNLGHAMACLAIVLDAEACGKLEDDTPYSVSPNIGPVTSFYALQQNLKHRLENEE